MTHFLLDVNVLIALIDPTHVQHDNAHEWFGRTGRKAWATCPLTQNGVLRILGHPRYPNSLGTPAAVAELMTAFLSHPGHEFWSDNLSLLNGKQIRASRLLDSSQITDSYLLALAAANNAKLATFDRHMVTDAVRDGSSALFLIQ